MSQKIDALSKSILSEIDIIERHANQLPQKKDIDVLKKVCAVWVVSGSGSCLKPLLGVASDRKNKSNGWYHGTDKLRLDFADKWLEKYSLLLPTSHYPTLIYNGLEEQRKDLFKAIEIGRLKINKKQVYIAPGKVVRTLDQVKHFSLPPNLGKNKMIGIVSNASHLARILRFMNKNRKIFKDVAVLALPVTMRNKKGEASFRAMEVKGTIDYIKKGKASVEPYPYILL